MSESIHISPGMSVDWYATKPTGVLRWVVPDRTTVQAPRLQQLWEKRTTTGITHEWLDVPTEVVPTPTTPNARE